MLTTYVFQNEDRLPSTTAEKEQFRQQVIGQKSLMNSNILLINANAVGSETLKNLVLPGVGNFTILDHSNVSIDDIGVNFFVTQSSLGQSRAQVHGVILL